MQPFVPQGFELVLHPASLRPPVSRLQARLSRASNGALQLHYVLEAQLASLRIPGPGAPQRKDELWRHTCFESFIRIGAGPGYYEINLSPSSQWAVYRFDSYRQGMRPVALAGPPTIAVRRSPDRLELDAQWPGGELVGASGEAPRSVALATVIEADDGSVSYWALQHPPGKPDFHHPDAFVESLSLDSAT